MPEGQPLRGGVDVEVCVDHQRGVQSASPKCRDSLCDHSVRLTVYGSASTRAETTPGCSTASAEATIVPME